MKLSKQLTGIAGLAMAAGVLMAPMDGNAWAQGWGQGMGQQAGISTTVAALPMEDLSTEEQVGLTKMREEEKLARDIYQALYNKWNVAVFYNISSSEQQHMNAVKVILDKYSMEDPIKDSTAGVFTDPDLQKLYESLLSQGQQSLVDALQVGATIEDLDLKDLSGLLAQTDNQDIALVYQNLAKGSRNHLRSFVYQLSLNGVEYEAQYLSAEELNNIITAPMERGRVDQNGQLVRGRSASFPGQRCRVGFKKGFVRAGKCLNAAVYTPDATLLAGRGNGNGHGPGDGTGNGGTGPGDGTGNGSTSGTCVNAAVYTPDATLLAGRGNGRGHGPGDGTGNGGTGPGDGTGNGSTSGTCVNAAVYTPDAFLLAGRGNGGRGGHGPGDGTGNGGTGPGDGTGNGSTSGTCVNAAVYTPDAFLLAGRGNGRGHGPGDGTGNGGTGPGDGTGNGSTSGTCVNAAVYTPDAFLLAGRGNGRGHGPGDGTGNGGTGPGDGTGNGSTSGTCINA